MASRRCRSRGSCLKTDGRLCRLRDSRARQRASWRSPTPLARRESTTPSLQRARGAKEGVVPVVGSRGLREILPTTEDEFIGASPPSAFSKVFSRCWHRVCGDVYGLEIRYAPAMDRRSTPCWPRRAPRGWSGADHNLIMRRSSRLLNTSRPGGCSTPALRPISGRQAALPRRPHRDHQRAGARHHPTGPARLRRYSMPECSRAARQTTTRREPPALTPFEFFGEKPATGAAPG